MVDFGHNDNMSKRGVWERLIAARLGIGGDRIILCSGSAVLEHRRIGLRIRWIEFRGFIFRKPSNY